MLRRAQARQAAARRQNGAVQTDWEVQLWAITSGNDDVDMSTLLA